MPPIAILGLGCRFPLAPSPRAYWRLLHDEVDAIREVPPDRWDIEAWYSPEPGLPNKMNTRWGGFIDDIDQFDAEFFKITPREAAQMDPQQRLILEVAHEALDDAGLPADRLAGTRTTVCVGVDRSDYAQLVARGGMMDPFSGPGGSLCVVSNRLSYLLDLRGPAMSIDTACSSSLVALHLAAQSLASGESELALVGGVSALLSPAVTVAFSSAGFMAPDGRCKPFDARADGYVRGEGAGVVVLKRLDAALRDGDRVRAVLLGTAVNQDGRSNGLTAPNGLAQQAVIRAACGAAGIRPDELEYVEAHGTGTFLGDPIEAHALGAVLAPGRGPDRPCAIGSVKSNVGHLEAAAGIAGLIKVVLALEHRTVPGSLHFAIPNPHIPFASLGLAVQAHTGPWSSERTHRVAGISSFGFGGTNAHAVVREAPRSVPARDEPRRAVVVPLSAQSPRALEALVWSYLDELGPGGALAETGLEAIARTAACHRTHHRFRLAVTARSRADFGAQLRALLDGQPLDRLSIGRSLPAPPGLAFVFSGQGTQWVGMGRQLMAEEPMFRTTLERVDAALSRYLRRSIVSLLMEEPPAGALHPDLVAPAIFAIQLGLDAVWRSLGITPAAIIGHSVGEIAAACAAGALTLDDAARVISARSHVLRGHQGRGHMLAASIDEADAERRCAELAGQFPDDLAVAAVNGPQAVAFSGSPRAIATLLAQLARDDVPCARIEGVEFASHGPQMAPLMDALADAARAIAPHNATTALYSTVLGARIDGAELDARYWARNLREPVRLWAALLSAIDAGIGAVLEIGPHPALREPIRQTMQRPGRSARYYHSIRRGVDERDELLRNAAALHTMGYGLDWSALYEPGPQAELPAYPWRHRRHWFDTERAQPAAERTAAIAKRLAEHPAIAAATCHDAPEPSGDARRIAEVVARTGHEVDALQLRRWLRAWFEARELPVTWRFVPEPSRRESRPAPLDVFGELAGIHAPPRIDRRELPAPEVAAPELAGGDAASAPEPRTAVEQALVEIWAEVLDRSPEALGIHHDFFAHGGHSLLAARVVARIRARLDAEVPVRAVFEAPTVAALARRIGEARSCGGAIARVPAGSELPLSFAQQRLWLIDRLEGGSAHYNIPVALRLSGALDVPALERSLQDLHARHQPLRDTFVERGGGPIVVLSDAPFVLRQLALPRGEDVRAHVRAEIARPFDLASELPWRALLLRVAPGDHALVLTLHHIVCDGWSTNILADELRRAYEAHHAGRTPSFAPLPVQYADYAAWQRDHLRGEPLERQLAYWKQQLAGAPAVLELPLDHPRPPAMSRRGGQHVFELGAPVLRALQALSREHGTTLYMTMLAAFQTLLHRYSRQDDVLVGSPIAGRTRHELEGLVGFFVNTLVMRADFTGNPPFCELLRQVRETAIAAYAHQDVPFEKLVEELAPERSLSYSPVFQAFFQLEKPYATGLRLPEVTVVPEVLPSTFAKFDLLVEVYEELDRLILKFGFARDLFEDATIARMAGHFERLLEAIVADPHARTGELSLLPERERAQLLVEWNTTHADYPREPCLHHLFEQQVARAPEAVAVQHGTASLTYRELDRRANQLAHHLSQLGVRPEALVGICLERSLEMIVGMLGVLKAGGAYVPLDPAYPAERLQYMLQDARARVLVTRGARAPIEVPREIRVVRIDRDVPPGTSDAPVVSGVGPDHLAYVIYTSGSTGRPKGVAIAHRSPADYVQWARGYFGANTTRGSLGSSSISFDVSVFELFTTLASGGTIVLVDHALALADHPAAGQVTWINTVPSAMSQLLELGAVPPSLETVDLAGEAVSRALVDRLYAVPTVRRVVNLYGPTETGYTTFTRLERGERVHIGRPLPGVRIYLLDHALQPVPIGVAGDLYASGVGVARGYFDQPGMTAQRFVPDPFSGDPGARMYRTGDLARYLPDGNIEYLGRADAQVKLRGFRIELGEVESRLRAQPGVRAAAVIVREDTPGDKRLVAYLVAAAGAPPGHDDLRRFLGEMLPDYMVPSAFVWLERLPQTPNGKLDRKALPAPEIGRDEARHVAPRTPTEVALAEIWAEVLGLPRVGLADNFFHLGGHSLLATRMVSRVREVFGGELPVRAVFETPTMAALASRIEAYRAGERLPPIVPVARDQALPLSLAQQRIWFLQRLEGGSAYNIPVALRLGGALDTGALARGLAAVVARHELLRTTFPERDGRPVQQIEEVARVVVLVPVIDVSELPSEAGLAEARRRADQDARRPFDLERGPLLRAELVRLGPEDHVLLLCLHHIVADGWSLPILMRELAAGYAHARGGGEGPVPGLAPLAVQYADVAAWQQAHLVPRLAPQLAYWRQQLAGAPSALELPTDRPRPAVVSYAGASLAFAVDEAVTAALEALGRTHDATLFMVLQSAWAVLLGCYSRQDRVVVGVPVAGRSQAAVEPLIGMFVNTLALANDLSGQPSFAEVLRRGRKMVLGAFEHQDVPFEQLVEALQPVRDLSRNPVFQTSFTLDHERPAPPALAGLQVLLLHDLTNPGAEVAKFDLSLDMARVSGGLEARINYSTALFEPATIARMARQLGMLLRQVVAAPEAALDALVLSDEAERGELAAWNATEVALGGGCPHELIAAQAARTPAQVAVIFEDQQLTYGELLAQANQLAHHLRGHGVGPDVIVAVLLERSLELVVALVGILQAGAAYLALDPEHPAERLAFAVRDAGAPVLVTSQALASRPGAHGARIVYVDADWAVIARQPISAPEAGCTADDLAYVLYTSGSTGRPKGVMISHRGLSNYIVYSVAHYLTDGGGAPVHSSIGFDLTVTSLLCPLAAGQPIVLIPDAEKVEGLADAVRAHAGFGLVKLTPSHLRLLEQQLAPEEVAGKIGALVIGGEALSVETLRFWQQHARGTRMINEYGPTETVVGCCVHQVSDEDLATGVVPIGRPIWNMQLHVLDSQLRPVAVGMPGELCVGGVQVARGYLRRPGLTAERFVPDPFSKVPGARMYRTGDLARYRPGGDGVLEFLGRIDLQIKLRGYRIELGEIEAALRQVAGVRDAAVAVRDGRLAAYLVGVEPEAEVHETSGALPAREALRAQLAARLPTYMIPDSFTMLDAFPLNASGKLDRKALPAPELAGGDAASYAAPRTAVEQALVEIWAEVLGRSPDVLGVHDDFFAHGGHSLLAARVVARIRARLETEVPVRAVFEAPTVAALASRIEACRGRERLPPIVPVARDQALPLSLAQQRIWFLQRLEGGSAYNIPMALRLSGALDAGALARALAAVVARHEVLRTTFPERDGQPVQQIEEVARVAVPVPVIDVSGLPPEAGLAEARRRADQDARRQFELERGPLLRAQLVRLGPEDHVLLLCLHHIVADGGSMPILAHELAAGYAHACAGQDGPVPSLEPLAVQYPDVAAWQQAHLVPRLAPQLAYWRQQLAGAPSALELPTDRPRPAVASYAGASVAFAVDAALTAALEALGRAHDATLFMVLQSAWAVLLGRYSRQDRVVVGVPVAHRGHAVLEPLIGMFVNTLALANDLTGPSFACVLRRGREMVLGAFEHQDVPFEQLVEALQPVRDLSRNPVFQTLFTLEHERPAPPPLAGLHVARLHDQPTPGAEVAKFDLSLSVTRVPGGLEAQIEYSTALFEPATIARMARQLGMLLRQIVAAPEAALDALVLSDEAERAELAAWSATEVAADWQGTAYELIAQQVARTPERIALVHGDAQLSYAELGRRVRRRARYLRRLGVGPESKVAVLDERGPDLIVTLVAVLAAGGAYVPLDPEHPAERLAFSLRDSRAQLLVTRHKWATLAEPWTRAVCLDREGPEEGRERDEVRDDALDGIAGAEDLAYVIYTSGSTGTPKGVAITHRGLANFLHAMQRAPGLSERDTLLAVTTVSFDIAALELLLPLVCGARIVLADSRQAVDPDELTRMLHAHGVTVMQATPATWRMLVDAGWAGAPALRILCGGEALPARLAAALCRRGLAVWNLYGPTEAVVWASTLPVIEAALGDAGVVALGRPLPGVTLHILDAAQRQTPVGVPGELCIGGVQVARGYLNRPGLTAERFVPDPFSAVPGARMYRTGDLVRYRPDGGGAIEFLGRIDFQVKLRGHRIELGEIEAALRQIEGVGDAVVVVRDERLAAYVVTGEPGALPAREALRAHLAVRLPAYMVPDSFTALAAFPQTPSGKLDRKALPAPEVAGGDAASYAAPRTAMEQALIEIWAEVLGRSPEALGIHDDFFAHGGHSLLAVRVVTRIRARLDAEVPVRAVFEAPTVAALARRIEACPAGDRLPPIVPVARDQALPLSLAQQRIWFLQQLEGGSAYNIPVALRLGGALDAGALARALAAVVARHELLRTTFPERDGQPVQQLHAAAQVAVPVPVIDLSGLPPEARLAEARRRADDDARRPFDLARGPLLRVELVRLGPDDHVLLLCLHHLVADGWSIPILMRELAAGYAHARGGGEGPVPGLAPLAVQYADVAAWQQAHLVPRLARQLAYWRQQLAGAPSALELPTDRPRPAVASYAGASVAFAVDEAVTAALEALGRAQDATLFMVLESAWAVLLARYSRQDRVVVGVPVAGRNQAAVEPLIGMFVNTLALHHDLSGQPSFACVLRRGRERVLGAFEHQDAPFEQLVEALQPVRDLSRNPVFQTSFTLEHERPAPPPLAGLHVARLHDEAHPGAEVAKFDLSLDMILVPGGLEARINYSTALFEPATIARMARQLGTLLRAVAAAPEAALDALALSDEAERGELAAWSATEVAADWQGTAYELIARQIARTPERIALVQGDAQLSYAELGRRVRRLARCLRRLGVGPESKVAVLDERGPDLIVTLVAVLATGGAYVPLDPEHPAERLAFSLRDSRAQLLVTRQKWAALAEPPTRVVCLDRERPEIERERDDAPDGDAGIAGAESIAYVIYTSGSTGTPKGVAIAHRGLASFLHAMKRAPGLSECDTLLAVTTVSFDIAALELLLPLVCGARIVLADARQARDPDELTRLLGEHGVTVMQATPATWRMLVDAGWAGAPALRILCGGEALPARLAAALCRRGRAVWNLYGPTEAVVWASTLQVTEAELGDAGVVALGRPLPGVTLHILDAGQRPVPVGVPGELCIGGVQVARGYLNRPALTAERFVPDPFSAAPGARMYRTGDLVRYRPEGGRAIEFLGRIDLQIKLHGHRIEPGEIEAALREVEGVRDAVVVVRGERLAAYVVPGEPGARPAREALRAQLAARLPAYMVPDSFTALDAFPRTASGKLDRKALPAPKDEAYQRAAYVAPATPTEQRVAAIWREVLGAGDIGRHDHFFALGGHSLLVIRLVSQIRCRFGVELPPRAVFESPTIAGLAERIVARARGAEARADDPAERALVAQVAALPEAEVAAQLAEWSSVMLEVPPTSAASGLAGPRRALAERLIAQHRIDAHPGQPLARRTSPTAPATVAQQLQWDFHQRGNYPTLGIHATALAIRGPLDVQAMHQAIADLIERQASLRTVFYVEHGRLTHTAQPCGPALDVVDLSRLPAGERTAEARRRFELISRPHDLTREVFRAQLVRLDPDDHFLYLAPHHIALDGFSWGVLATDLAALYRRAPAAGGAPATAAAPELAPLELACRDFCFWQTSLEDRPVGRAQLAFWARAVAGYPGLELPGDRRAVPRGSVGMATDTYEAGATPFAVEGPRWSAALRLCARLGTTPYVAITSGFLLLLARWSGRDDVCALSSNFHRNRPGSEAVIGNFVTPYPLRMTFDERASLEAVVRHCHDRVLAHREHGHVAPRSALAAWPEWTRYNVNYLIDVHGDGALDLGAASVERLPWSALAQRTTHDLALFVRQDARGVRGNLVYNAERFSPELAARAAARLDQLIDLLATDPAHRVGALPRTP